MIIALVNIITVIQQSTQYWGYNRAVDGCPNIRNKLHPYTLCVIFCEFEALLYYVSTVFIVQK
jgi:hypothetical protein